MAKGSVAKGSVAKGKAKSTKTVKSARVTGRIRRANEAREQQRDIAGVNGGAKNGKAGQGKLDPQKDRIVLLVRDSYWLQASWEITRQGVLRAQAAMAEHWHSARPILRVVEVDRSTATGASEQIIRDIDIHGGVNDWFIDVPSPPQGFRVDIGYLSTTGKFQALARSNSVTTPPPGSCHALDHNWLDVADNYERIYALSGGHESEGGDLQDVFEERLRRPMGTPMAARFGVGAERVLNRDRKFGFEVDAEMIIFGTTNPSGRVTLAGEPVKVRPDGSFTVRVALPNKRQVIPVVAASSDGIEQRTTVLAVERNTKVMETVIHDPNA